MGPKPQYFDEKHEKDRLRKKAEYEIKKADREALILAGEMERPTKGRKPGSRYVSDEHKREVARRCTARWKERNKEREREQRQERIARNREYVLEIKETTPCIDCGQIFHPVAMDFHHREGEEKSGGRTGGVAKLVTCGAKLERLIAEIDKCEVICACCHRVRTHEENGWYSYEGRT